MNWCVKLVREASPTPLIDPLAVQNLVLHVQDGSPVLRAAQRLSAGLSHVAVLPKVRFK